MPTMYAEPQITHKTTPPGPPLPTLRKNGARLLSLDGGGVKGVSSVLILDAIMKKVKEIELSNDPNASTATRKPVDYFDLGAGTSTGGLIALMLFRLRMDTQECLDMYRRLASTIFAPVFLGSPLLGKLLGNFGLWIKAFWKGAEFDGLPLEKAVQQVVDQYSERIQSDDPWKDYLVNPNSGMMLMLSTLKDKGESILLRSYPQPEDAAPVSTLPKQKSEDGSVDSIKIVPAARATSAAPFYLPQETWNDVVFWDGGVLNNNPIEQLWNARYDLTPHPDSPPPKVSCVLSLGCGWTQASKPGWLLRIVNTMVRFTEGFMANTEAKHRDFKRLVQRMKDRTAEEGNVQYFRLNVDTNGKNFDMADYKVMPALEKMTNEYIKSDPDAIKAIKECARLLASRE